MKKSLQDFRSSAVFRDAVNLTIAQSILLISADKYALQSFAEYLSLTLMCEGADKPCMDCAECHKILHHNHVDVQYYPKENKTINSGEIADLLDACFQAPYSADRKIFILNDANSIDAGMQNKLLKTLEEPPKDTFFILLATEDNSILPTIKSRCRKWHLPEISAEEIESELLSLGLDSATMSQVLEYCGGNCSLAKEIAGKDDFMEMVNLTCDLMTNFRRSSQMIDYASKMYKMNDDFEEFLTIFLKNCDDAVKFLAEQEVTNPIAKTIASDFSINALIDMIEFCQELVERRQRNCNFNTIVDSFLFRILEVRHKWPI